MTEYSRVPRAETTEYLRLPRVAVAETTEYSRVPKAPNAEMTDTRWYWYSCDLCHIAQMLPVPGSKFKYFREHIIQVLRVVGVFRAYVLNNSGTSRTRSIIMYSGIVYSEYLWLMYCGILRVLAVFRGSVQRIHAVFWGSIPWIFPVLQVFQGSVLQVLHVLVAFRPLILRILGVL